MHLIIYQNNIVNYIIKINDFIYPGLFTNFKFIDNNRNLYI